MVKPSVNHTQPKRNVPDSSLLVVLEKISGRASVPVAVRVSPTRILSNGAGKFYRVYFRDHGLTNQTLYIREYANGSD